MEINLKAYTFTLSSVMIGELLVKLTRFMSYQGKNDEFQSIFFMVVLCCGDVIGQTVR